MELFDGRPVSCEGRLPREVRVYDYLDNLEDYYKELKKLDNNLNNTTEEYIKDLNKRLIKK